MDKHDEIHGFPSGGSNVGVTPGELVVSTIEADARAQQGASSGGSGLGQAGMSSGGLSSFSLYWDVATKAWKCHEPLVLNPDGTSVSVTEPQGGYGTGDYYLHVKQNPTTKAYTAEIKAGGSTGSSDELAVIKLFTIAATEEGTKQYHVGAYVIGNASVVGEVGKTDGSDPATLTGGIDAAGATNSGLVVRTYKEDSSQKLRLDLGGDKNGKTFSIHRILNADGTDTGHRVFATMDINEPPSASTDSVDALTGFTVYISGHNVMITFKKTKIKNVKTEDVPDSTETLLTGEPVDVVSDIGYGNGWINRTRRNVLALDADVAGNPEDVIETTPHSQEM